MSENSSTVEQSTTIDAPPERVDEQVADLHRRTAWSLRGNVDPDLRRTYSGAAAGTGAVYRWAGNRKAGAGRNDTVFDKKSFVTRVMGSSSRWTAFWDRTSRRGWPG